MRPPAVRDGLRNIPRIWDGWAIALAVLSVLAQGHRFGVGNQEWMILRWRRMADPSFLAGDWMLSQEGAHPLIVGVLGRIAAEAGEWTTLFGAHVLTRVLLFMGVVRLAAALFPKTHAAPFVAVFLCMLEPRIDLGRHFLQGGHFEPHFLAMALATWALAAAVRWTRGDNKAAWKVSVATGLTILVHLFVGLPVLVVVCASMVLARGRRALKLALFVGVMALLIGLSSVLPAFVGFFFPEEAPLSGREVLTILQVRHPHHYMPWLWGAEAYAAGLAVVVFVTAAWARRRASPVAGVFLVVWLTTCLLFVACSWWRVLPAVAYFQPFRLWGLAWVLAAVYAAGLAKEAFGPVSRRWRDAAGRTLPWALAAGVLGMGLVHGLALAGFGLAERHWHVRTAPVDAQRREAVRALRATTPPDEAVTPPLSLPAFRLWEQRPTTVDWKEVPYKNRALRDWAVRIAAACGVVQPVDLNDPSPEETRAAMAFFEEMRGKAAPDRAVFEAQRQRARHSAFGP